MGDDDALEADAYRWDLALGHELPHSQSDTPSTLAASGIEYTSGGVVEPVYTAAETGVDLATRYRLISPARGASNSSAVRCLAQTALGTGGVRS